MTFSHLDQTSTTDTTSGSITISGSNPFTTLGAGSRRCSGCSPSSPGSPCSSTVAPTGYVRDRPGRRRVTISSPVGTVTTYTFRDGDV